MSAADPPLPDGLVVLLPEAAGAAWTWWRMVDGRAGNAGAYQPGEAAPWGTLDEGARVTALLPGAPAPVIDKPLPAMPQAQALAAERIALAADGLGGPAHVAVGVDGDRLLAARVLPATMDLWLAACAAAGLEPAAMVPAALVLPRPAEGLVLGTLGDQVLARSADAAFAGEPALIEALGATGAAETDEATVATGLAAVHARPPLNLRQGVYAPRRVAIFRLPAWLQLARMAALAALLVLVLMLVWIVKWNAEADAREARALAAVQARFPAATDLDTAERVLAAEAAKRGAGATAFAPPAAALLAAMRPVPSLKLRDLGYASDGTLRFTAAAPRVEDINAVLIALQDDGWKVTVPPALAPDPTGATVAAITVRAP